MKDIVYLDSKGKKIKKIKVKSRTEAIDFYISIAETGINLAQSAINLPVEKNFSNALECYENWLFSLYNYIKSFDKKTALLLFSSPDGVRTSLNFMKERSNNVSAPVYSFVIYKNDDRRYVDEMGVKTLENIILSYKSKIDRLILIKNNLRIENKKHGAREDIKLKTYGVTINGKQVNKKGVKSEKVFTDAEENLIYFLYFKYISDKESCFSGKFIAKEIHTTNGYVKNIIFNIHKKIGKIISPNTPLKVMLIINKPKRGYCLNHRVLLVSHRK